MKPMPDHEAALWARETADPTIASTFAEREAASDYLALAMRGMAPLDQANARYEAAIKAHRAAIQAADPTLLVNALAPDPYDVGALLRKAIDARRLVTGESDADLARRCIGPRGKPLHRAALSRAAQPGSDARPSTVRAVLRALGLRVALVPEGAAEREP